MFDNSQAAADVLKGMVGRNNKRALETIKRLEKCGWHSRAFADAMAETGTWLDENGFSFSVDVGYSVERLINAYLAKMDCEEPDPFVDLFDMKEASEHLGISYDMMKTYVSRQGRIRGKKVGAGMVFTRQQLDRFKPQIQPAGNPDWVKE